MRKSSKKRKSLFAAGVLGDSLGALRHGVLGELSREVEPDRRLDFATGDGVLLVVVSQAGGLRGDALKDVVDEGVHDAHGLAGDASVGVDLLQDFVDIDGVALLAGLLPLLGFTSGLGAFGGSLLFTFLRRYFSGHS